MNLNYKEFKEAVAEKFIAYLPQEYQSWKFTTQRFPKVNGFLEGFNVLPDEEKGAAPTFYFKDLYKHYLRCQDLNEVLEYAAEGFVRGMEYVKAAAAMSDFNAQKENIIFALVSQMRNTELLDEVPHRPLMDMAVIYRMIVRSPEGGFNSAIITHDIAKEMKYSEEELFKAACENTPRIFPLLKKDLGDGFYLLTNEYKTLGAAAILYPGVLETLADELGASLILLPSSIHEFFAIPMLFKPSPELQDIVKTANATVCNESEILSDTVYVYDREKKRLEMTAFHLQS